MNDITKSSNLLNFILFADDTNIFHSHKYINTLVETLNNELKKVSLWFKCNKLSLNVNKTCFLHFSNHNPINIQRIHIFIDNLPIIEKKSTKFLGVILDSNLKWTDHYHKVTTSVSRAIGVLYKLKHILTKKALVMLYNSRVLPHITYCNIVWGNSNQSKLNSVLILQKKALRICTHSNYLAHTNPIFHELKTLTLHDIHTYQTSIFMF